MKAADLESEIERLAAAGANPERDDVREVFTALRKALSKGEVRAAEPDAASPSGWRVNPWVKRGILLGFKYGNTVELYLTPSQDRWPFLDKDTLPLKHVGVQSGVRIVPGGSSVRDGAYLGQNVTCMPPMYINVGAYVDDGTMVDSHALVGSCAQVGKGCHISAASQIGGVLEPVNASPVIVEDEVLIGGNCGVYEGTVIKHRAVLGTGTILNRSTPVYDIVRQQVYRATDDEPLLIPEEAVVIAGSRAIISGIGKEWGLSVYTPIIVKYRDSKTDAKIQLEDLLR